MIVYSKKIITFSNLIRQLVKQILSEEVGLKVGRNRFLDWKKRASYPINIVIYNNKSMLGYFDANFYELGFHECLMQKKQLTDVIRHELAHYLAFILHGTAIQPHGQEIRTLCERFGWGEEIHRATTSLEELTTPSDESPILRKVQKLMALTSSSNAHEAEAAMIKSQALLLKHNLDETFIDEDEKIYLKRILKQQRESSKMRAIGKILETFFVSIVFNRGQDAIYLEILGEKNNVEIADYVAAVLNRELDNFWKEAKRSSNLRGATAKNSFFLGIATGYCKKIDAFKQEHNPAVKNALLVMENKLLDARAMAYPHLSHAKRGQKHCSESAALGEKIGKKLNINPAVSRSCSNPLNIGVKS